MNTCVRVCPLPLLGLLLLTGCSPPGTAGSEAAARKHVAAEFDKWIARQPNEVSTMESRINTAAPPINYNIRSVFPEKPDSQASAIPGDLPGDWESWPAYGMNVMIEFRSQAGTPLEKVATYRVTWNAQEKRWYVAERFL